MSRRKRATTDGLVISLMNGYVPRMMEEALVFGGKVRQPGKSGDDRTRGNILAPRLKHRSDGRTYITGGISKDGYVRPKQVNPQKGKEAGVRVAIDVLWDQFSDEQLEGVIGCFNSLPVYEHEGLEQFCSTECMFKLNGCAFQKQNCKCVWRPNQLMTWGRIETSAFAGESQEKCEVSFVALTEVIRGKRISVKDFAALVQEKLNSPAEHNEHIDQEKLIANIHTIQRTNFHTANCFGLHLHQFGIAVETSYSEDGTMQMINLALNARHPVVETLMQAKYRIEGYHKPIKPVVKKEKKVEIEKSEVEKRKEEIKKEKALRKSISKIEEVDPFEVDDIELESEKEFVDDYDEEENLIEEESIFIED